MMRPMRLTTTTTLKMLMRRPLSTTAAAGQPQHSAYDVVIVGGGPMGASAAYHLAAATSSHNHSSQGSQPRILVIEKDSSYRLASAMLSAGGVRQQFSVPENVRMSRFGAEFLKQVPTLLAIDGDTEVPDVQFHEYGYLFLSGERSQQVLRDNHRVQRECGVDWMQLMDATQLEQQFPWLNVEGIAMGSYGTQNEGYFDPWALVKALKKKAMSLGVEFVEGTVVGGALAPISTASLSDFAVKALHVKTATNREVSVAANTVVLSAGAWSAPVVQTLAATAPKPAAIAALPVRPRKRCIFNIHCPGLQQAEKPVPPYHTPLVVDPSGVYFRPEGKGNRFITGVSPSEENDPDVNEADLQNVDHSLFNDIIWPALYERVPAFQELKVVSSWAGFYEYNTVDQNGIIGEHSEIRNLLLCNGFSGHGLQQSPAAGRAISELILHKKFQTIDLSRFSFQRIVDNKPIFETGIV